MSDLSYDVEQLYIDGLGARQISAELGCPLQIVTDILSEIGGIELEYDNPNQHCHYN